jgi:hypothetical protein
VARLRSTAETDDDWPVLLKPSWWPGTAEWLAGTVSADDAAFEWRS